MRSTVIDNAVSRWLIGRDMDEILGIDNVSHEPFYRWNRAEWSDMLKERSTVGRVIVDEDTERVFGFVVYRLQKPSIQVLKLAVHPLFRRRGIGAAMLREIESKVTQRAGREFVTIDVCERELPMQLLLNKRWWRCVLSVGPSHDRVLRFVFRGN